MKYIQKIFLILIGFFLISNIVSAKYISIDETELGLVKNQINSPTEYGVPKSILLVPIAIPESPNTIDPLDWYKGVYYYQTTRFGLPSTSFHYMITEDGRLIDVDKGLIDRKIMVQDATLDNPLVVGYLTSAGSTKFSPASREQIEEIILDLANKNAISIDKIYVKSVVFETNENRQLIIKAKDIYVGWQKDLDEIKEKIKPNYLPVERTYSVSVENVELPKDSKIGDTVEAKLKIKNTGEFPIYKDSSGALLLTKLKGESSQFFINDVWESQSQVALLSDSVQMIKPGETVECTIKLKVPFAVADVKESFEIRTLDGAVISDKNVDIDITIAKPEGEIIEIGDTGAGYLKVRSGAGVSFQEITRVSTGEKFYVVKRENGWVQIKLSADKTGWVAGQYTKVFK